MGTIADKLERVLKTKKDIQSALVKNGKYVPDKLPFRYYPDLIDNMNINGLVGMYYGKGLTNEELSKDPTWYDTSGNGNDLKFKNFAWRLDSGAGIFIYDFTKWNPNMGGLTSVQRTSNKIQVKGLSNASVGNVYDSITRNIGYNYNFKIKITGIKSGNKVSIRKGASSIFMEITQDGVYYINTTVEEDWDQKRLYMFVSSYAGPDINLTIEQIPDYEGAICFNGIDDCAVCDNFPILTKEKGYTVMALRKWLTFPRTKTVALASKRIGDNLGAFLVEKYNSSSNPELAISFGLNSGISINNDIPFVYQTSNSYNSTIINTGDQEDTNIFYIGASYTTNGLNFYDFGNSAIYALCIIDHDTSDAEREIVINKWKQYYPELFPDQAYTVKGKTNDDSDRSTIKNLTGNGNNLILNNFAFTEDSGYNSEGYLVTDGVDDKAISNQFKLGENFTVILDFEFPIKEVSYCGFDLSSKARIQNKQGDGVYVVLKGNRTLFPSNTVRAITSDGKVYDENWNEYNVVPGDLESLYTRINLGFDGSTQFAKSATKLAGIYSSILTKDQCIKAYNYLQTFKIK